MLYRGDIKYNNISSATYGLIITEVPELEHSPVIQDVWQIPGRDGNLYGTDISRGDAEIKVKFALHKTGAIGSNTSYQSVLNSIYQWLNGGGSGSKLVLSDDPDMFYEVQQVNISNDNRVIITFGYIEVTFTVYPFKFKKTSTATGTTVASDSSVTVTLVTDPCKPLYKYSASENGSITINDKVFNVFAGTYIYIDVRRLIAYNSVGAASVVGGDYKDLMLKNGSNTITTSEGVSVTITDAREGFII